MNSVLPIKATKTMSSIEIADLVRARHNDVFDSIERLFEQGILRESRKNTREHRTGGRGRPTMVYDLTKRDTLVVASGYSAEMRARIIDRWQELESTALPALDATAKLTGALAIAECYVRLLRPAPSSQVAMLTHIAEDHGISASFLPAYVVDAAPDAANGSSMVTKSLTALLREHKIPIATPVYNMLLVQLGFLRPMTRASKSRPNGQKEFYAITDAGLRFGKNITSPKNSREVSPHWYCDRFLELHALVDDHRDRLRAMGEAA